MAWELTHSGTTKDLDEWSITNLARECRSQSEDTVTFSIAADAFAASGFSFKDAITIAQDSTQWFVGIVTAIDHFATGSNEGYNITLSGPWWYLENLVFQQTTKIFQGWSGTPGEDPILVDTYSSRIALNQAPDGSLQGTADTIDEVLDWLVLQGGALMQWDSSGFPDMQIPMREERDITCADAIRRQLAYMDAVTWFDYSTTPPTLNIKRRTDLTAASLALDGTSGVTSVDITPRSDLQVPYVHLKFEKTYQDTYGSFLQIVDQYYPDPIPANKFGALIATVILQPTISVSQYIETELIEPWSLDWWQTVREDLNNDQEYAGLELIEDTDTRESALDYYIKDGAFASWMDGVVEEDKVSAKVSYRQKELIQDGATSQEVDGHKVREQVISIRLKATDLETGTYSTITDAGEDPSEFAGLAQSIYTDLNALQYDGKIVTLEGEVSGTVGMGNKLNLMGGMAAWASMNAAVQAVAEFVDEGRTEIEIGPNKHLTAGELVDLLRVNRTRQTFRWSVRATAQLQGDTALPSDFPGRDNIEAPKRYEEHVAAQAASDSKQFTVVTTAKDALSSNQPSIRIVQRVKSGETQAEVDAAGKILLELSRSGGRELRIREAAVCVDDGEGGYTTKYIRLLCTEEYTPKEMDDTIE
jgi:hypothetical protein